MTFSKAGLPALIFGGGQCPAIALSASFFYTP
jgi:hypothetical protein